MLGPFIAVVPAVVAIRAGTLRDQLSSFSEDPMWPWVLGALLFLGGLFVVAFHQYWRSVAAVIISLFGWFLLLRGLTLLAAPQLIVNGAESATETSSAAVIVVRVVFGLLALCGVYLAYVGWLKKVD
ncbi:putative membrane protein [Mycobacterium xenopi 3993]|nr:putative membrane protein [Mycobacterium xenopi 3993]